MERREIPGTAGFTVDINGNVFDAEGKQRATHLNGDGYLTVAIKRPDECWVTRAAHRLVAETFLPLLRDDADTEVCHRYGDHTNNYVYNLEWVTATEFAAHAEIMNKDNPNPSLYSTRGGQPGPSYLSAYHARADTRIALMRIWESVQYGIEIDGLVFHHCLNSGNAPKPAQKTRQYMRTQDGEKVARPVKALDFLKGDVLLFRSIQHAAEFYDTGPSHIFQSIPQAGQTKVFRKQFQLAYQDEDFPELSPREIARALARGAKEIFAYHAERKAYCVFSGAKDFIDSESLDKDLVMSRLSRHDLSEIGPWRIVYSSPENRKRLKDFVVSAVAACV